MRVRERREGDREKGREREREKERERDGPPAVTCGTASPDGEV